MASDFFPPILSKKTVVSGIVFFAISVSLLIYKKGHKQQFTGAAPVQHVVQGSSRMFTDTTIWGRMDKRYLMDDAARADGYTALMQYADTPAMSVTAVYNLLHNAGRISYRTPADNTTQP